MKIKETVASEKFSENHDDRSFIKIEIDGKQAFGFTDGEPEDNNLRRDFRDCYGIAEALKAAFEAGKAGEELEYTSEESDDWV